MSTTRPPSLSLSAPVPKAPLFNNINWSSTKTLATFVCTVSPNTTRFLVTVRFSFTFKSPEIVVLTAASLPIVTDESISPNLVSKLVTVTSSSVALI